jgi:hypothetical protein
VNREVQMPDWLISSAMAIASTTSAVTVMPVKMKVFFSASQNRWSSNRRR